MSYLQFLKKEDITFRKFVIKCARSQGENIKEEWGPEDVPKYEIDESLCKKYNFFLGKKEKLLNMNEQELLKNSINDYNEKFKDYNEKLKELKVRHKKYETIKQQVLSWQPPTEKHTPLKKSMTEEIESVIKGSESNIMFVIYAKPKMSSPEQWKQNELYRIQEKIDKYKKEYDESIQRSINYGVWERQLLESLEEYKNENQEK